MQLPQNVFNGTNEAYAYKETGTSVPEGDDAVKEINSVATKLSLRITGGFSSVATVATPGTGTFKYFYSV